MQSMNIVSFGKEDVENVLAKMSPSELDELAFGAIQLNGQGVVLPTTRPNPASRAAPPPK